MTNIKGTVGIPHDYFLKMAKHDYENYRVALPREFYQNSIDAGASQITVTTDEEARTIIVEDNGCGMNLDVLQNKLLVLGGSHKAEGSVGAFGKAKEILFFSWKDYTIHTQDLITIGAGADYEIVHGPRFNGTRCTITVQNEEDFGVLRCQFMVVATKMQTKTKIFVDGNLVECKFKRGKLVMSPDGIGNIHQNKSRSNFHMQVRINGIWMFSKYVGDGMGELILELSGASTDILTSNRDGFKWETSSLIGRLLQDLMINKAAALIKKTPRVRRSISGTGKIVVGEPTLSAAKTTFNLNGDIKATIKQVMQCSDELTAIQKARINEPNIIDKEWDDFVEAIKFIGYEPDFVLLHHDGQDVTKFLDSRKARLLANMWTEIVKQVLIDYKKYLEFTVGFIFDDKVEACIVSDDTGITIYLNPNPIKISGHRKILMETLKDLAIHEVAHLAHGNHDSDFVNEMAEIRKTTYASDRAYYAIQRTNIK